MLVTTTYFQSRSTKKAQIEITTRNTGVRITGRTDDLVVNPACRLPFTDYLSNCGSIFSSASVDVAPTIASTVSDTSAYR